MEYVVNILENFLGPYRKYNEDSGQVSFDCPACSADDNLPDGDGKGNLEINYFKNVYKCWKCKDYNQMHGNIYWLFKRYTNGSAWKEYKLYRPEGHEETIFDETIVELPDGFQYLTNESNRLYKYDMAMKYLTDRGITPEMISRFSIGYTTLGKFYNRIIIPSYDENGYLNYFTGRWFDKKPNKTKYLNPDIDKQNIIFNEYLVNWDATIHLVEGPTDHIVTPNSIPLLGKYLTSLLFDKLQTQARANVVILLDGDAWKDAVRLYNELNVAKLDGRVRICKLPSDLDPSSIVQQYGLKGLGYYLGHAKKLKHQY